VLGATLKGGQTAMLKPALSFHTWRSLMSQAALSLEDAVGSMVDAIVCQPV